MVIVTIPVMLVKLRYSPNRPEERSFASWRFARTTAMQPQNQPNTT